MRSWLLLPLLGGCRGLDLHVGGCPHCDFREVADALAHARKLRSSSADAAVRLLLHPGHFRPFRLTAADSGKGPEAPLRIEATQQGKAVVSAGIQVPTSSWKPAGKGFADGTLVADLSELGITKEELGALPVLGGGVDPCDQLTLQKMQLYHEDEPVPTHLARYPNMDPETREWRFLHTPGGAANGFKVAAKDAQRLAAWSKEKEAFVHGYWSRDWADQIASVRVAEDGTSIQWLAKKGPAVRGNARFIGLNLLQELDAPGEYIINVEDDKPRVFYMPSSPVEQWATPPVVTMNASAIEVANGTHDVRIKGLTVAYSRATGILAQGVDGVVVEDCKIFGHGGTGATIVGTNSGVSGCEVRDVGCRGLTVHGGDMRTMTPGNSFAVGNRISRMAQYKRTYQPGIHWGGVKNRYAHNHVSEGPHNCFLGGGNEVDSDMGGADCVFEYNTLDRCAFESSDTGAFYTCGQQGTAYVNPGNELRHNVFTNIMNTEGFGVEHVTVQAVYFDDQMSNWHVWNNTFVNCTVATFIGGGRLNIYHDNHYEDCGTAHHFDNRGMNWERGSSPPHCDGATHNKSAPCIPKSGKCQCNPAALRYELAGPAGAEWRARYPALAASVTDAKCENSKDGMVPCYNVVANNTYCRTKRFTDASQKATDSWHSDVYNNSEVPCRFRKDSKVETIWA